MSQIITGRARPIRVALSLCRSGLGLGTGVLTADGEIPVEYLEPGERVVTFDAGIMPLSRVIVRTVPAGEVIRVRPSVLDPDGNGRDVLISARQKLLLRDWRAKAMFGKPAALIEAARLVDAAHMVRLEGMAPMRLFQLVFDDAQHIVQIADWRLQVTSARLPAKVAP